MMSSSLPRRVIPVKEVLFQPIAEGAVVLHMQTEVYYSLDDVGTRIWQLLEAHQDVNTVIEHLLAIYDVDEAVLRQDLADLIAKLHADGLITTEM
jgi:hypothetical protein